MDRNKRLGITESLNEAVRGVLDEGTHPHHDLMNALNTFKYSHVTFSPKNENGKHNVELRPKSKNGKPVAEPFSRDLSDDHYTSFRKWFYSSQANARKRQPSPLPTNEEVEPIDELKRDIKFGWGMETARDILKRTKSEPTDSLKRYVPLIQNGKKGTAQAAQRHFVNKELAKRSDKLTKQPIVNAESYIDELSYNTLKRYRDAGSKTETGDRLALNKIRKANGSKLFLDPKEGGYLTDKGPKVAATNPPKKPKKSTGMRSMYDEVETSENEPTLTELSTQALSRYISHGSLDRMSRMRKSAEDTGSYNNDPKVARRKAGVNLAINKFREKTNEEAESYINEARPNGRYALMKSPNDKHFTSIGFKHVGTGKTDGHPMYKYDADTKVDHDKADAALKAAGYEHQTEYTANSPDHTVHSYHDNKGKGIHLVHYHKKNLSHITEIDYKHKINSQNKLVPIKDRPLPYRLKEEAENILTEISRDKAKEYVKAALKSRNKHYDASTEKHGSVHSRSDDPDAKIWKRRVDGINTAISKLSTRNFTSNSVVGPVKRKVTEEVVSEANDSYKKHPDGSSTWEPRDGQPYAEHGIKIMYRSKPYMHNGRSIPDVTSYAVHKGKIIPDSVASHPTFTHNAVNKYLYGKNGIAVGKQK